MTLLEALVVVAITAMLGAIAWPEMRAMRGTVEFGAAAADVAATLSAARADAVRTGTEVVFDPAPIAGARLAVTEGATIRFFADGSATGGTVVLAAAGRRAAWRIDAATGRIAPAP